MCLHKTTQCLLWFNSALKALESNVWNWGGKKGRSYGNNFHGWLVKMPAMRKFNVHSSERKSGKIIVSFACVYHYCSYLRLPLLPEPNLSTPGFLSNLFFLSNQWNTVSPSYILPHALPISIYSFIFWSLEMPFYFILLNFLIQPSHCMNLKLFSLQLSNWPIAGL